MHAVEQVFFYFLMVLFGLGVLGCALTIPLAAFKFFSVLFEKDNLDTPNQELTPEPHR